MTVDGSPQRRQRLAYWLGPAIPWLLVGAFSGNFSFSVFATLVSFAFFALAGLPTIWWMKQRNLMSLAYLVVAGIFAAVVCAIFIFVLYELTLGELLAAIDKPWELAGIAGLCGGAVALAFGLVYGAPLLPANPDRRTNPQEPAGGAG